MNETKEEALSVALELFSREGYTAEPYGTYAKR